MNKILQRKYKDVCVSDTENSEELARLVDLNEKLDTQVKLYKRKFEESEAMCSMNYNKFRFAQNECNEALDRADLAELTFEKFKSKVGMVARVAKMVEAE